MAIRRSLSLVFMQSGVIVLVAITLLLIAARVALPILLTKYLNDTLNDLPGFSGNIADVDIHLWRGAYSVHGIEVQQVKGNKHTPLFNADHINLSVDWRELFRGNLVGQIQLIKPKLNIEASPRTPGVKEQKFRLEDLVDRFSRFSPLRINRFAMIDGELRLHDAGPSQPIDLYIDQIDLAAHNLTNSQKISEDLWATVSGTGRAMGSGAVSLQLRFNPSERRPTYELAFELKELRLTALNDYLRHYLSVVARDGRLSLYAESAGQNGRFKGYVKPVVKDLDVLEIKNEKKGAGEAIKGFFVKLIAGIFENKPQEQIATKVEFAGAFDDPEIGIWDAVLYFVRNAFVEALKPGLDATVAPRQAEKAEGAASGKSRRAK